MKRTSLTVAVCAVLLALTAALGLLPAVFFLPALFAACCFGFGVSFFASTAFGLISLMFCFINPSGLVYAPVVWYFTNNWWLPIVARMFIGPIIHAFYLLMKKAMNGKGANGEALSVALTAALGSLLNTVFVGALIMLIGTEGFPENLDKITVGFLAINGAIEIAVTALILPPVVLAVKKASPKLFIQLEMPKKIKDNSRGQEEIKDSNKDGNRE